MLKLICFLFPWKIRRLLLQSWFGYKIHPTARIGLAWVFPRQLVMAEGARIGHFTVAIHLDKIEMERQTGIGRSNWITGFPTATRSRHFSHIKERRAELLMRESSAITKNHHIDCTDFIEIGGFATIAGYHSQLLTHSIDIIENRQHCAPIAIGAYSFVGTNVVILGGSVLPSYSVLSAKSLLNKSFSDSYFLYGGTPAMAIKPIPASAKYFNRTEGFVF